MKSAVSASMTESANPLTGTEILTRLKQLRPTAPGTSRVQGYFSKKGVFHYRALNNSLAATANRYISKQRFVS